MSYSYTLTGDILTRQRNAATLRDIEGGLIDPPSADADTGFDDWSLDISDPDAFDYDPIERADDAA